MKRSEAGNMFRTGGYCQATYHTGESYNRRHGDTRPTNGDD